MRRHLAGTSVAKPPQHHQPIAVVQPDDPRRKSKASRPNNPTALTHIRACKESHSCIT
jgi:hypothetical protein